MHDISVPSANMLTKQKIQGGNTLLGYIIWTYLVGRSGRWILQPIPLTKTTCEINRAAALSFMSILLCPYLIPSNMLLKIFVFKALLFPSLPDGDIYSNYIHLIKGRGWKCKICEKEDKRKSNMVHHVDSKHLSTSYVCPFCQHVNKTEDSRRKHIIKVHETNLSLKVIKDMALYTL